VFQGKCGHEENALAVEQHRAILAAFDHQVLGPHGEHGLGRTLDVVLFGELAQFFVVDHQRFYALDDSSQRRPFAGDPKVHGVGGYDPAVRHLVQHLELQLGLNIAEQDTAAVDIAVGQLGSKVGKDIELGAQGLPTGEVVGITARPAKRLAVGSLDAGGVDTARIQVAQDIVRKIRADDGHDSRLREQAGGHGSVGGGTAHDVGKHPAGQGQVVESHGADD